MPFQNIIGVRLVQEPMTTTYTSVYTTPESTRTYVKGIDVCNTTNTAKTFSINIVVAGDSPDSTNALFYATPIQPNTVMQWTGTQIMNEGDSIQISASASGCTVTISGGEAT